MSFSCCPAHGWPVPVGTGVDRLGWTLSPMEVACGKQTLQRSFSATAAVYAWNPELLSWVSSLLSCFVICVFKGGILAFCHPWPAFTRLQLFLFTGLLEASHSKLIQIVSLFCLFLCFILSNFKVFGISKSVLGIQYFSKIRSLRGDISFEIRKQMK